MKIEPCPFCGDTEIHKTIIGCPDREGQPACLPCDSCGCNGPWDYLSVKELDVDLPSSLLKLWNSRKKS